MAVIRITLYGCNAVISLIHLATDSSGYHTDFYVSFINNKLSSYAVRWIELSLKKIKYISRKNISSCLYSRTLRNFMTISSFPYRAKITKVRPCLYISLDDCDCSKSIEQLQLKRTLMCIL